MKVQIHEYALKEFNGAIDWYDFQSPGLGLKFKDAVYSQIEKIKKNPTWFLVEAPNLYKAYIPKFPYKILFTFETDTLTIWAFANLHRKPDYWVNRIQ